MVLYRNKSLKLSVLLMPDLSFSSDGCTCFKFSSKSIRYVLSALSPHLRASKRVLDSGFWIPHSGFRISSTGFLILCQWHSDSGFNREIPDSGFQNPGFHGKNLLISIFHKLPYSGIPYMRQTLLKLETVMPHLRQKNLSL